MTIPLRGPYQVTSDTDPPRYVPGYWYTIAPTTAAAGSAVTTNAIRAMPWIVRSRVRVSALGGRVTTGAAGLVQFAIYRANATTLNPMGSPLANTADVDVSVAQNVNGALTQGTVTLGPGLHWFCYVANAGVIWQAAPQGSPSTGVLSGAPTQAVLSSNAVIAFVIKGLALVYGTSWPDVTNAAWNDVSLTQSCLGQFQVAP